MGEMETMRRSVWNSLLARVYMIYLIGNHHLGMYNAFLFWETTTLAIFFLQGLMFIPCYGATVLAQVITKCWVRRMEMNNCHV